MLKELAAHESGEKLHTKIEFNKTVLKNMGAEFVDKSLLAEAQSVAKRVYKDQSSNRKALVHLIQPAVPYMLICGISAVINCSLRGTFHQIGRWAAVVETAASGDTSGAYRLLFTLWFGHMVIEYVTRFDECYGNRAELLFGRRIRNGVLAAMLRQDYEYFDRTAPGVLQERLNHDAAELGQNLIRFPQRMIHRVSWIGVNVYFLFRETPFRLASVAVIPLFVMIPLQYFVFSRNRRSHSRQRKITEKAVASTSEILREIKTVRQFAMEPTESCNYARGELSRSFMEEHMNTTRQLTDWVFWSIFCSGLCLTVYLGIPYVLRGEMKASELLSAVFKINCNLSFPIRDIVEEIPRMGKLLNPLGRICDLLQAKSLIEPPTFPHFIDTKTHDELLGVLDKCVTTEGRTVLTELVDVPTESPPAKGAQLVSLNTADHENVTVSLKQAIDFSQLSFPVRAVFSRGLRPQRFRGHIEFRNVSFSYPTDLRKPVLNGISFTVEPGQKVALVGATGCGKSSVMSLLQRLYDPSDGEILIDGIPLPDYDIHFLRSRVVIVDQNTVLFNTTIRDNIGYGLDVTDEEIVQACKDAKAWEFICEKPDKLMTVISDGGKNLSGGQRQRLAIARAMVRKPDVILLDEATSALDNENEAKVQEALDIFARRGSALVIAHRLSTIMDSDKIIVVDHGKKAEEGTHVELLAKSEDPVSEGQAGDDDDEPPRPPALALYATSPTTSATFLIDDGAAPLHRPSLRREKSATTTTTSSTLTRERLVSYKRLWDAATGGGNDKMSIAQMQDKEKQLEKELSSLHTKMDCMKAAKNALVRGTKSQMKCDISCSSTACPPSQLDCEDTSSDVRNGAIAGA